MERRKKGAEKLKEIPRAPIHITERDQADLKRFRAALAKLTPKQKGAVISRMLEKPGTP